MCFAEAMLNGNYNRSKCSCNANCEELKFQTSVNKFKIDQDQACDDNDGTSVNNPPDPNKKADLQIIVSEKIK